jgi:hypothetical protein
MDIEHIQYYAYEKVERGPLRIIFSSSQILCTGLPVR